MARFRKRGSRWHAEIRKQGIQTSKSFRVKALAENWARRIEDSIEAGTYEDAENAGLDIAGLLDKYEDEFTPKKRAADRERSRLKMLRRLVGVPTTEDVLAYFEERVKEGVAPASARKELNTLSVVYDAAIDLWGWSGSNPVTLAKSVLRKQKRWVADRERIRRFSRLDEEKIFPFLSEEMQRIVRFAIETGMRRGEIVAARPEHVHGSLLHIPQTKTDVSRTIPLTSVALELAKRLPFGLGESAISHSFHRACARAGLKDLRFHDLRHEATSRFFERGLQIQEVALITGHRDWKSLKRYTQLRPEDVAAKLSMKKATSSTRATRRR